MPLYCRNQALLETPIDDECVVMDPDTGTCIALNPVGSRIWELLKAPHTFEEIILKLCSEYDVSEEECRQQTQAFLSEMTQKKRLILLP